MEDQSGIKKKLKISFSNEAEIDQIVKNTEFKINTRGILGVKNKDDWIYALNIGNIMHLSPLEFEELGNEFIPETQERYEQELTNDSTFEKVIFLSSAYFCIATELRFLHKKVDQMTYPKKLSEMWHAKAVHT